MGVPSGSHYMSPGLLLGQDATTHLAATQRLGYARTMSATGQSYADVPAIYGAGRRVVTTTLFTEDTLYAAELADDPRLALMPAWERESLLAGIADNTAPPSDPRCETSACCESSRSSDPSSCPARRAAGSSARSRMAARRSAPCSPRRPSRFP